jgi:hypothetical protein
MTINFGFASRNLVTPGDAGQGKPANLALSRHRENDVPCGKVLGSLSRGLQGVAIQRSWFTAPRLRRIVNQSPAGLISAAIAAMMLGSYRNHEF